MATTETLCGVTTKTLWSDLRVNNRGFSGTYAIGILQLLAERGLTYVAAGKPIPSEFKHNVADVYGRLKSDTNLNNYHFPSHLAQDWSGMHATGFIAPNVYLYLERLGIPTGVSMQDFVSKRDIFYFDMAGEWIKKQPSTITIDEYDQTSPGQLPPDAETSDSYKWLLDSVDAGEFYARAVESILMDELLAARLIAITSALN